MLYTMRYRTGSLGVQSGFIEASSQAKAEEVGNAWCNLEPFRKYISVSPAIIADESILPHVVEAPPVQPSSVAPEVKRKAS